MVDAVGSYDQEKTWDVTSDATSITESNVPIRVRLEGGGDTTGTGATGIDDTNVDGKEDIGFFDPNNSDASLTYYWERFDTTNNVYIAWVLLPSVSRDGSTQLKAGIGSGSTDDASTETNLWDNVGPTVLARWGMEEASGTTLDSTSNNVDSTSTTGTTYEETGQYNNARGFDGTDDLIEFGRPSVLTESNITDVSIIAWMNADTLDSTRRHIVGFGSDADKDSYHIRIEDSSNQPEIYINDSTDNFTSVGTGSLSTGTWYMMTGTYDASSGDLIMYLDGSQANSATTNGGFETSYSPNWNIGERDGTSNDWAFDGLLDEIQVYDAVLSAGYTKAQYDQSPKAGYVLLSANAATTNDVAGSVRETVSGVNQTQATAVIKTDA